MHKILKNVTGTKIKLKDVGTHIDVGVEFAVPFDEVGRFVSSQDTLQAIRDGDLQVSDGTTYYTDPYDGEVYFRTLFGDSAYIHDGTAVQEYTPILQEDLPTGKKGTTLFLDVLTMMREFYNAPGDPLYVPDFQPLLGPTGREEESNNRILNLEVIHGKTGWHQEQVKSGIYQQPDNLLIFYGWLNSFNSAVNGWNNESVAQDMAKYSLIVLGDGIQDPGHGDYANTQIIIPRVQALNPCAKIFGYVTVNQTQANFETKAGQWNTLGVDGIFMDEAGYDFGTNRETFNDRVDFVHGQTSANICFVNSWTMDHIIGTTNDVSYPNTTWNPNLVESNLVDTDWYLLESFPINTTAYSGTGGYETKSDWSYRGQKAVNHRDTYGMNLAAVGIINNGNANGQDLFEFGFISACQWALESYGTSDALYGAGTSAVDFWDRPDVTGMGRLWACTTSVQEDVDDANVYWRYVDFGKFMVDFSSGAQTSSITVFVEAPAAGSGPTVKSGEATTDGNGDATVTFNTAFPDTNYAITITALYPTDVATCMFQNKVAGGFDIKTMNDQGNDEPTVTVTWIATPYSNP